MTTTKKSSSAKDAAEDKRGRGRPSLYKPEYAEQAAKLCKLGATDAQLADFFGVAVSTVALWKVQHQKFSDALKLPKQEADEKVAQSLYRRAVGYEHDEVDIRVVGGELVQTAIRKHYPPDPTAMIFWLKNRCPEKWREMKAVELTGEGGGPVKFARIERTIVDPKADR